MANKINLKLHLNTVSQSNKVSLNEILLFKYLVHLLNKITKEFMKNILKGYHWF